MRIMTSCLIDFKNPNQPLQLTAGILWFNNIFGVAMGFGLSEVLWQTLAATELSRWAAQKAIG